MRVIQSAWPSEAATESKTFEAMFNHLVRQSPANPLLIQAFLAVGQNLKKAGLDLSRTQLSSTEWKTLSETTLKHSRNWNMARSVLGVTLSIAMGLATLPLAILRVGLSVATVIASKLCGHIAFATVSAGKLTDLASRFSESRQLKSKIDTMAIPGVVFDSPLYFSKTEIKKMEEMKPWLNETQQRKIDLLIGLKRDETSWPHSITQRTLMAIKNMLGPKSIEAGTFAQILDAEVTLETRRNAFAIHPATEQRPRRPADIPGNPRRYSA
jgi:hypothetical protein